MGSGVARGLWQWWKAVARKVGDFQGRAILTLFYFVVLAPFALAVRLGSDPLAIKPGTPKRWIPRPERGTDPWEQARKQF